MESGIPVLALFFATALMVRLISYVRLRCFECGHEKYLPPKWLFRSLAFAIPVVSLFPVLHLYTRSMSGLAISAMHLFVSCWLGKYFYDRSSDRHAYFATGLEADPTDPYFDNDLTDLIMVSIAAGIAIASLVTWIATDVSGHLREPWSALNRPQADTPAIRLTYRPDRRWSLPANPEYGSR